MKRSHARLRIETLEDRTNPTPTDIGFGSGVYTFTVAGYNLHQNNADFTTTSSAFGFVEANMTQSQQVDTLSGGFTDTSLTDAFDGALSFGLAPGGLRSSTTYFDADGIVDVTGDVLTGDPNANGTDGNSFGGLLLAQQNAIFAQSPTVPVIRSILTVTNPTAAPITQSLGAFNNLGSDGGTTIFTTSSGDATFDEATDRWVVTFEEFSGSNSFDPRLLYVMQGAGTVESPYTSNWAGDGDQNPDWIYDVTVGPGETKYVMLFLGLYATRAAAAADGGIFNSNASVESAGLLAGLTADQLANTVNWEFASAPAPSSLAGFVYSDADNDGVFDTGEAPIPGATVTLTGVDDLGPITPVVVLTGVAGDYSFPNLRPGTYTITETQPAGFLDGRDTQGTPGTGTTGNDVFADIVLAAGVDGVNNNLGELQASSLAGFVYSDSDNDGVFDAGEAPISGVTVTLTGTDDLGNPVNIPTTTSAGAYSFANLRPGTYTITETQPAGFLDGRDTQGTPGTGTTGNDAFANIVLAAGVNGVSNNFGELAPSSLAGFVYRDADNDGVFDAGEAPIPGTTVTLTGTNDLGAITPVVVLTGVAGDYTFPNLRPGTYTITETQPTGFLDGRDTQGTPGTGTTGNDAFANIVVAVGVSGVNNNFGELAPASLSGFVYRDADNDGVFDAGEAPIPGTTVTLTGTNDLGAITPVVVLTGVAGDYTFPNLRPGTYTITETQPAGSLDGRDTQGTPGTGTTGNDAFANIVLAAGVSGVNNNFGELAPASLSGFVYRDADNDGVFDAGEAPIPGTTVTLTGTNDLGAITPVVVLTSAGGAYSFPNLRPGTYTITETQPAGSLDGRDTQGTPGTGTTGNDAFANIVLAAGVSGANNNFGELAPSSLAGFVYRDADNDGVFDAGEASISGVTVTLTGTDDLGNPVNIPATTTGAGAYSFPNLRPGTYTITESQPAGFADGLDTQGTPGTGTAGNDVFANITLAAGVNGANNNFGERLPTVQFTTAGQSAGEAAGTLTITVELSVASGQDVTVPFTVGGTASSGGVDYTIDASPLVILAGTTSGTITITVNDDSLDELDETVIVTLGSPTNATLGTTTVHTATIADDDAPPSVTLQLTGSPLAEDGGVATVTATLSAASGLDVTVDLGFTGTAVDGVDYSPSATSIVIPAGTLSASITLTGSPDALDESDETIVVDVTSVANGDEDGTQQVTATIADDDAAPTISIDDVTETEGVAATFTITLSTASGQTVSVNVATADGTAVAPGDYSVATTTVTFTPGDLSQTFTVGVVGDSVFELGETFFVNLSGATNATIADGQGVGTITNDDAAPTVSIDDVTVSEADGVVTFTVTRTGATEVPLSVNYATADGTAVSVEAGPGTPDFNATGGTLTFNPSPNATETLTVTVTLLDDDARREATEQFLVNLSGSTNGTLADSQGVGTVTDDDPLPGVSLVGNPSVAEGNAGTTTLTFTVTTSVSAQTVTVSFATADGTATLADNDYESASGVLTFLPGEVSKTVVVTVNGDGTFEADETVLLALSDPTNAVLGSRSATGTITNDDLPPSVTLRLSGSPLAENGGQATVTAELSAVSALEVTVNLGFTGTATGADYTPSATSIVIPAGALTGSVTLTSINDALVESSESIVIDVTGVINGNEVGTQQVVASITDDDVMPPGLTLRPVTLFAVGADAGGAPLVKVFNADGTLRFNFSAYGAGFRGGVRVAVGDVNGDGIDDLITGAGAGGGPHVRIFSGVDLAEMASFFAYGAGFGGGVHVGAGDVNGDGRADVITGAGAGGGPHVRVFDGRTLAELRSFFAFGQGFLGGVTVAAGDVDGDRRADIVTGAGAGAGPHVKVFSGATNAEIRSFFAYGPVFAGGVFVAAGDIDGDGRADLVTGAGAGGGPHVKVFSATTHTEIRSFFGFPVGGTGGVRVAAGDLTGDGRDELILGSGFGSQVRALRGDTLAEINSFLAFDALTQGVYVG